MSEPPPAGDRCVVLLYPGCTIAEIIEIVTRLRGADVPLEFVSADGGDVIDQSGLIMIPDRPIDEIDRSKVGIVIVPGGDPEAIIGDAAVKRLLNAVVDAGGVVAGICAGVLVLGDAGVLAGRHITHNYRAPWAPPEVESFVESLLASAAEVEPTFGDVVCVDRGRVDRGPVDRGASGATVITALPNATIQFTTAIGQAVGLFDDDAAELLERHLQGEFVAELFED